MSHMPHFFHSASKAFHHPKHSEADKERDIAAAEQTHKHNHHVSIEEKLARLTARGVRDLENDVKKGVDAVKKHNAAAHEKHHHLIPHGDYFESHKAADAAIESKVAVKPKDAGESKDAAAPVEAKQFEVAREAKAVEDPKEADGEAKKREAPKEGSEANEGEDSKGAEETKEVEAPKETEGMEAAEESKEGEAAPKETEGMEAANESKEGEAAPEAAEAEPAEGTEESKPATK